MSSSHAVSQSSKLTMFASQLISQLVTWFVSQPGYQLASQPTGHASQIVSRLVSQEVGQAVHLPVSQTITQLVN